MIAVKLRALLDWDGVGLRKEICGKMMELFSMRMDVSLLFPLSDGRINFVLIRNTVD